MAAVKRSASAQTEVHATSGKAVVRKMEGRNPKRTTRLLRTETLANVRISEPGQPVREVEIDPIRVKVAVIAAALGSKARAAEYLGVARSQPGKWLAGEERPNPRARRLLQDFDYVWARLTDERSPDVAELWLSSPNAFLNGATPITWMKTRGAEDVVGAIDAEEAGSFA